MGARLHDRRGRAVPAYDAGRVFAANQYSVLEAVDAEKGTSLWETEDDLPNASSLLAYKNLVYVPTAGGTFTCLDAATGKTVWQQQWEDGFFSSPVEAAGRMYIIDMKGYMHIIAAGKTFKEFPGLSLGEKTVATPAFKDNYLYIRQVSCAWAGEEREERNLTRRRGGAEKRDYGKNDLFDLQERLS